MMSRVSLVVPVALFDGVLALPRSMERVAALAAAYRADASVPAIPVGLSQRGALRLEKDGNHRLAACRAAGLSRVAVSIDPRDAERLRKVVEGT